MKIAKNLKKLQYGQLKKPMILRVFLLVLDLTIAVKLQKHTIKANKGPKIKIRRGHDFRYFLYQGPGCDGH